MERNSFEEVLVPQEALKLLKQMIGSKQTIMSCALARIYTARSESEWIYSNLQGIICLIWDREMQNTPFLRLFDVESFDLLLEMEMYIDFQKSYATLTPFFSFFSFQSAFIGIRFASSLEAREFGMKIMHQSLKSADMEEQAHHDEAANQKKKQKSGGLFGIRSGAKKLFGFLKGSNNDDLQDVEISKPIQVKHDMSLQFDIKTNQVDLSNLPEEWLKIFERAGISRKDLSDEELAPDIFECVCRFQSKMSQQLSNSTNNHSQQATIPQAPPLFIPDAPPLNIPNAPPLDIPIAPPLNIPIAPPLNIPIAPPLNIPSAPVLDMKSNVNSKPPIEGQTKASQVNPRESQTRVNMLDQIKMGQFHLRKVEVNSQQNKANLEISSMDGKAQEDLSLYLSRCIAERRKQLRKNHHSSSEESSSDDDD